MSRHRWIRNKIRSGSFEADVETGPSENEDGGRFNNPPMSPGSGTTDDGWRLLCVFDTALQYERAHTHTISHIINVIHAHIRNYQQRCISEDQKIEAT